MRFGKIGKPVVLAATTPVHLRALARRQARRRQKGSQSFYGHPLVAWGRFTAPTVRGAVEPDAEPLAPEAAADDAGHGCRAAPQGGALVLQGSRPQPVAPAQAGDDVVEAVSLRIAKLRFRVVKR